MENKMAFNVSPEIALLRGIYKITNTHNGMYYIGSTSRTFDERYKQHIRDFKSKRHCNIHMLNSYRKNPNYFTFEVIHVILNKKEIELKELEYLNAIVKIDPLCYNITKISAPKERSQTSRERAAISCKAFWSQPEQRARMSEIVKGYQYRINKEQRRERRSKKMKGMKRTAQDTANHMAAIAHQMQPIICKTNGKYYYSSNECSRDLGMAMHHITKQCKGGGNYCKGHIFVFAKDFPTFNPETFMLEKMQERVIHNSRIVLNTESGVFYNSMTDAAKAIGMSHQSLSEMLSGKRRNKTSLRYI